MKHPKQRTVVLQELEWTDQPRLVPTEYPAEVVETFINWLRQTKAWWEDPEAVQRKLTRLNADLAAIRQAAKAVKPTRTRREVALANLAKARAAKRKVA